MKIIKSTIMKHKILYVDDEPINLMLFQTMFKSIYDVLIASSGAEGLDLLQKHNVEVVLSDMRMPNMTGLEFIGKAKARYPGIIFFILTGYEITPEIREALNTKLIDKYFQKPFDMKELNMCISQKLNI